MLCQIKSAFFPDCPFHRCRRLRPAAHHHGQPDHGDFRSCQMGIFLTLGQIGTLGSALLKTGALLFTAMSADSRLLRDRWPGHRRLAHRRGIAIPGHFMPANRAASSNHPRSPRHRRRFGRFLEIRSLHLPPAALPRKTPSGQPISVPKRGRKPGPFLETSLLFPPLAALRLFPHNTVENFVHNVENFPLCHPVEKL